MSRAKWPPRAVGSGDDGDDDDDGDDGDDGDGGDDSDGKVSAAGHSRCRVAKWGIPVAVPRSCRVRTGSRATPLGIGRPGKPPNVRQVDGRRDVCLTAITLLQDKTR